MKGSLIPIALILINVFILNSIALELDENQLKKLDEIFSHYDCKENHCDLIEIKWPFPRQQVTTSIALSFNVSELVINLNLTRSEGILVGPKTPVYFLNSGSSEIIMEKRHNMFTSDIRSQLYEDIDNSAMFTINPNFDDQLPPIKYGFIGNDNIIILPLLNDPLNISSKNAHYYLAKSGYQISRFTKTIHHRNRRSPDYFDELFQRIIEQREIELKTRTIYPKILVLVDHIIYKRFNESEIIPYLLQFWSGVDLFYRNISSPKFKLSIGGVIISQDPHTSTHLFPSGSIHNGRDPYRLSVGKIPLWLDKLQEIIPVDTYNIFMAMASSNKSVLLGFASEWDFFCAYAAESPSRGAVFYESKHFMGTIVATHELAHTLGLRHDPPEEGSFMTKGQIDSFPKWSQQSIKNLRYHMINSRYDCMYNHPDNGNLDTEKITDCNDCVWTASSFFNVTSMFDVFVIIEDGNRRTFDRYDFNLNKPVLIYYNDRKLYVTQRILEENSIQVKYENLQSEPLKYIGSDRTKISLNLLGLFWTFQFTVEHDRNLIYIYEDDKPRLSSRRYKLNTIRYLSTDDEETDIYC